MKEIIIEVPDEFGKTLKPWKANAEIKEELVRCKYCKNNNQCSIQFRFADADNPGEWFCAYGKRKET